jgi:ribonuclease R
VTERDDADLDRKVLHQLRTAKRKHTLTDKLAASLHVSSEQLGHVLDSLIERGEVVRTRKGRVALASRIGLETGIVKVGRRGRAVVVPDEPDVPIALPRSGLRPAMHGDRVLVEVEPYTKRGLRSGLLRTVLERRSTTLVGTVSRPGDGGEPVLTPVDPHVGYIGILTPDSPVPPPDQLAIARIVEYPTSYRDPVVCVERILGPAGALPAEIEAVCHTLSIPTEFGDDALAEAEHLPSPSEADATGRIDLRDLLTFTVDPADARDFDDAVAIETTDGGHRLTVSIADVSHYVRPGTALDRDAFERGTSIYFPGRCVPMLPERLSSDLASLKPGVDRLTVSVSLDLDRRGRVAGASFARTIIRSDCRLTYEDVQSCLDGNCPEAVGPDVARALASMLECARALHRRRLRRGAIDLDLPEVEIDVDEAGHPASIRRKQRLWAHRIIEEFMLAANEAVARHLEEASIPFLYRIHERPNDDDVSVLAARLSSFRLRLERDGASATPAAFQAVVQAAQGKPFERVINTMVLRTLTQARYSPRKEIHFGLASPCYTHFTSPIRRYPDLQVHRALLAGLEGRAHRVPSAEALEPVADQCSRRERRAMDAERDVDRVAAILFMQPCIGQTFAGVVTGVVRWGYYVELDEAAVEGFVPLGRLDEYYEYVAERMELHSRTSTRIIRIGDRVQVTVVAADLAERRLEFQPEGETQ